MSCVIATLLVRDEEEIVQQCLEHHLRHGVDGFIVTDNGSKDHTRAIVASCSAVKEIIDEPTYNHHQSKWVTRMARHACRYGADWIVHLDADEFWYGLESLHDKQKWRDIGVITVTNELCHVPVTGLEFGKFVRSRMPYYYRVKHPMPKVIHRATPKARVSHGNHTVSGIPGRHVTRSTFSVHHYPVRSYKHFEQKTIKGGTALKKHPGPWSNGKRWRNWYTAWKAGDLPKLYDEKFYPPERIVQAMATGDLRLFEE